MTLVLVTDTVPGAASWTDASAYGSAWVYFEDPGNGNTLNPGSQSGELVATPGTAFDTRNIAAPGKLGQMLALSVRPVSPGGPAPFPTPVATFNFVNPINVAGDTSLALQSYESWGVHALLIATYVSLSNNSPALMWRLVV